MQRTKNFLTLIGIISAFVFGAVIAKTGVFEPTAQAQASQSKQWETAVVRGGSLPEGLQGAMNLRGEEGWEPVTVLQTKDGNFVAFLKRRK
ncbi:MAG: hypothetical protein M3384_07785 [Acidobacteriota bacterium]|nr:hypothetical protein [Acidobacteriota bacterium]